MNKKFLITLQVFLFSISFSLSNLVSAKNNFAAYPEAFQKFLADIRSNSGNFSIFPDLSDFKSKAQTGLNFMYQGSRIINLRCVKITDWSSSNSESLKKYLEHTCKGDITGMNDVRLENIISEFKNKNSKFGIMQWEILYNGISKSVNSISLFDENWNVLFDTELVNYFSYSESETKTESDKNSPNEVSVIKNQDSQTKSRSLDLNGTFGSVRLRYVAKVTAIVSPYITGSTNDAEYNYYTNYITCERINPSGIPPDAEPFLYFGTGGQYAILYSNATPSTSPIVITGGSGDRFNTGLYNVTGTNGQNWSFSFDFSVDIGVGIGITPHSNISALSLSANNNHSINLLNYVYNHNVAIGDVRAVFFNGGSLNANNFKILTGTGTGEIGKVNVTSKLQVGYIAPNISGTPSPNFFPETSTGFDFPVQFLRGNYVLEPAYQMTSTGYNIPIGQIDTIKLKITNNSHAVKLKGGSVSLNVASLNNHLTILSSATLAIDSLDTVSSKTYNFIVRGNSSGVVTPQANISAMGWGWPVPPDILINNIVSIDSNITVSPVEIVNISNNIPDKFQMYQNYPNPFNPVTKIKFDIPGNIRTENVTLKIYDIVGKEVTTLVNERLNPGIYEADWNATNFSSGVYYYRLTAGDFSEIRKMIMVK